MIAFTLVFQSVCILSVFVFVLHLYLYCVCIFNCIYICVCVCARGGGVLPSKRLLGICRWVGSHFRNWTDYNGVTFLVELLEWGRKFLECLG